MKLLTYETGNGPRCGVLQAENIVDITGLMGSNDHTIRDVRELLELGNSPIERVREALDKDTSASRVPLSGAKLLSPIVQPPTVLSLIHI